MKVFEGVVVSTKMNKTATVEVARFYAHRVYKKRVKKVRKYQVHDEIGVKVGQKVSFIASKPYSKTKKWKIIEDAGSDKKKRKKK